MNSTTDKKTTIAAILTAVSALFVGLAATLDSDPKTAADWTNIIAQLSLAFSAAWGLWAAADSSRVKHLAEKGERVAEKLDKTADVTAQAADVAGVPVPPSMRVPQSDSRIAGN